ncbi:MAG: DUF2155 domain-containing protein [Desulfuromonas sp.]|nr:MAG: DUF2155 domain-containing protein [Desulfuromonas sp.]
MTRFGLSILLLLVLSLSFVGCSREEVETKPPVADAENILSRVVVPKGVEGQWKAVRITVLDNETNEEVTYTVDIGQEFTLSSSDVRLKVNTFLPSFVMKGKNLTSNSNNPDNPAALISLREGGEAIFNGWLFSRFPGTHVFQHPRYSFTLVDFIPAPKKG